MGWFILLTYIHKDSVDVVRETVALKAGEVRSKVVRCNKGEDWFVRRGKAICRGCRSRVLKQPSWNSRGTTRTSLFFSLLSALCPPAQSPIENRGVCLQICWYSRWYSFILVIGFFILFCFSRCDNSATGNHDVPHTTNSSSVSYTNLYCSYMNERALSRYKSKLPKLYHSQ